jgi:hypothetical protein
MNLEADEQITNFCFDLVTLKRAEPFLFSLLRNRSAGEWVRVSDVCQQVGLPGTPVIPELFVTWLPDPVGDDDFVVIIFFNDGTKESQAAHYNRRRLLKV